MMDYSRNMQKLSDQDLLQIANATGEDGYEPAAITAAAAELSRRELTEDQLAELSSEVSVYRKAEEEREKVGLSNGMWLACVVVGPFLLVTWVGAIIIILKWRHQKAKDLLFASLVGLAFWLLLFMMALFFLG